jgi:hypothetical protein
MTWLLLITASAIAGETYAIEEMSDDALLLEATVVSTSCERFIIYEDGTRVAYYLSDIVVDAGINIPEEYDDIEVGDQLTVTWAETQYGIDGWPESCAHYTVYMPVDWSGPMHLYATSTNDSLFAGSGLQESHSVPMPEGAEIPDCGQQEQDEFIAELDDSQSESESNHDTDAQTQPESEPQPESELDDTTPPRSSLGSKEAGATGSCAVASATPGFFVLLSGLLGVLRRRR